MDNFKQHFINAENVKGALNTYLKFQRFTETLRYEWIEREDAAIEDLLVHPPSIQTTIAVWPAVPNVDAYTIRIHKSWWPGANGNPEIAFDYPRSLIAMRIEEFQNENKPMSDLFIHNFVNNLGVVQARHEEFTLRPNGSLRKAMISNQIKTMRDVFNDMRRGFKELKVLRPCINKRLPRDEAVKYLPLLGLSYRNLMKLKHTLNMPISPEEVTDEVMIDLI